MNIKTVHLKYLFQITAFMIFAVQMTFALRKYLEYPLMSLSGKQDLSR